MDTPTNPDVLASILVDMTHRQPTLSPLKREHDSDDDEIPSAQPAPKRLKTTESFSTLRNRIASIEARSARSKKSMMVLRNNISNSSCPVGLQYRPRPHIRPDAAFESEVQRICQTAEQSLLTLMVKQHEQNISSDNELLESLREKLNNHPDHTKANHKRIQAATSKAVHRINKRHQNSNKNTENTEIVALKKRVKELETLISNCKSFSTNCENKSRVVNYSNVSLTDSQRVTRKHYNDL